VTRGAARGGGPAAVALVAAAALLVSLGSGCGRRAREVPPPQRLLVFGIDGADWQRALPLIHEGRMPALARLARGGARRTLRSLPPSARGVEWLSPTIWTSAATGVVPERHGILHFVKRGPSGGVQPMTSNDRKVAALWNMLTARGLTVGVVGWLVTWPAEPVDGYMVSSYSPYTVQWGPDLVNRPIKGTIVPGVPHQVYPETLQARLERFKVSPDSVTNADVVTRFTHAPLPAAPSEDAAKSLEGMRWSWASDETYRRAYEELVAHPPGGARPLLEMLYFGSVDVLSHRFWKYMEPATYAFGSVDPAEVEAFGQAVESAYRSVDETLQRVLDLEADSVRVIVLSDHGFRENRDPQRPTSGWHRPQGLLVANGPGISRALLPEGSVIDVAPTVLYALGLPVAEDFDGRPALDLFTKDFRAAHPVSRIPSWEPEVERTRADAPVESPVDAQIIDRLKSLGYLQ
jgi:hypothetical protein